MKTNSLLKYILSALFLFTCIVVQAQQNGVGQSDDEFNVFLLVFASVFVCAMIGAAIIGAIAATLLAIAFFGLYAIGVVSTSLAIGLYTKSTAAGFKSFLMIVFGCACTLIAVAGTYLANSLFHFSTSLGLLYIIGGCGGLLGGITMALSSYKLLVSLINSMKLKIGV